MAFSPAMTRDPESPAPRPARLDVRLGVVAENYLRMIAVAGNARVAPVVKADAYGVGLVTVVRRLADEGADVFFVARLAEGIALRALVPAARIFVFDGLALGQAPVFAAHGLIPALNTPSEIAAWQSFARESRVALDAALQVDTGMNRSGLSSADVAELSRTSRDALADLNLVLVMSHLACDSDAAHAANRRQLERFRTALAMLPPAPASIAATGGLHLGRDYLFDLVRPGIGLYGGHPGGSGASPYAMAVRLTAPVIQLRHIEKGATVGYGATFTAARATRLAIVAMGYADGLMRSAGPRGYAVVAGQRVKFAGRISMDLCALDVTDLPENAVMPGTEVEFLGDAISLEEAGEAWGTNHHEVLTSISPRVVRNFVIHNDVVRNHVES